VSVFTGCLDNSSVLNGINLRVFDKTKKHRNQKKVSVFLEGLEKRGVTVEKGESLDHNDHVVVAFCCNKLVVSCYVNELIHFW
jgi:hypothetical protein